MSSGTRRRTVKCNKAIKKCAPCPHAKPHKEHYAGENATWDSVDEPCTVAVICSDPTNLRKDVLARCVPIK